MNYYLSGSYDRKEELRRYANRIERLKKGYICIAKWIQYYTESAFYNIEARVKDLINSDVILLFVEDEKELVNSFDYGFYKAIEDNGDREIIVIGSIKDIKYKTFKNFEQYYGTLLEDDQEVKAEMNTEEVEKYKEFVKYVACALWHFGPKVENQDGVCEMTITNKAVKQFFDEYKFSCNFLENNDLEIKYEPRQSANKASNQYGQGNRQR